MSERVTANGVHKELEEHKRATEERFRRIEEKFDKHQLSTIERLTKIETYQKMQNETLNLININVEKLKDEPRNKWNTILTTIITALVSGLVAFMLFRLGLRQ